jgi:Helix-turn-helix domain
MGESEWITVKEAREMLGVSEPKIAKMLRTGELQWEPNPIDHRGKLVRLADVEALLAKAPKIAPGQAA